MKIIGITGGIGSGKSEASKLFKERLNAFYISADLVGHEVLLKNGPAYQKVIDRFGHEILNHEGQIDRKLLGDRVFNDKEALQSLNQITHPLIRQEIMEQIERAKREQKCHYIVLEAALLIEAGFSDLVDQVWYIYADTDTRLKRLVEKRHMDEVLALAVIKSQKDDNFYIQNSQVQIDNSMDLEKTYEQIYQAILKIEETQIYEK